MRRLNFTLNNQDVLSIATITLTGKFENYPRKMPYISNICKVVEKNELQLIKK